MAIVSTTQDQRPFIDGQWKNGCEPIEVFNLTLNGCVFTTGYDRTPRITECIDTCGVRTNGVLSHDFGDIPFDRNEISGIGRESIETGIKEFIRHKNIVL